MCNSQTAVLWVVSGVSGVFWVDSSQTVATVMLVDMAKVVPWGLLVGY